MPATAAQGLADINVFELFDTKLYFICCFFMDVELGLWYYGKIRGQVFESRFILGGRKQQEAAERYIEKELHDSYSSPNIIYIQIYMYAVSGDKCWGTHLEKLKKNSNEKTTWEA